LLTEKVNEMNNVDYIEIIIFNTYKITKIDISTKKLKLLIDNKIRNITHEKINELLKIIEYWKSSYQEFILDAEKFDIKLISKNKIEKEYQGNGAYPYNYNDFKRWISDIL